MLAWKVNIRTIRSEAEAEGAEYAKPRKRKEGKARDLPSQLHGCFERAHERKTPPVARRGELLLGVTISVKVAAVKGSLGRLIVLDQVRCAWLAHPCHALGNRRIGVVEKIGSVGSDVAGQVWPHDPQCARDTGRAIREPGDCPIKPEHV